MNVRQDIIEKYKYILYNFFNQHRIHDEDIRQDFLLKYYKLLENFDYLKAVPIEAYLRTSLNKILKRYWMDFYRNNKIDEKYYEELSPEGKRQWELGLSIDRTFHSEEEEESGSILFVKSFMKLLTLRQQELIAHVFYNGLNFKEASVKMGSTKQNVSKMWNKIQFKFKNHVIIDFGSKDSHKLMKVK